MREFHTDFIQCACVTTVSDATAIVVATSHQLYSLTGRAFQEEFHSPHSIATPILSLTPIRHQSAVLLRTAESLQVVSFVEKRLVFCQSLPVRALACCAVRDTVYVVTEEGRRLAVRVFNLHTSRSSFTPQQTLLLSEGTVVGSACQVMSSEVSHCQVMPSETTNCQICADSSFVVVTYGNICHLLANNQGTLETVAQTRALSEPILSVCFAADSFFLVTPHAITSITPHLHLLHPLRSVLTGITPVTRPSLRLLQQILATPRPVVSAASLLTLLLLQQLQRLESVLQTVATTMAAEAEKVKEAWKWQLEEEKKNMAAAKKEEKKDTSAELIAELRKNNEEVLAQLDEERAAHKRDVADVRKKLGDDTAVVAYLKCVGRMLKGEDVLKASSDKGCEVDKRECPKCHTGLTKVLSTEVGPREASEA